MKCKLDNQNTKCMCRWGGCWGCWQTNPQVEYTNKVIDLWADLTVVRNNLPLLKTAQRVWVEPYLVYDNIMNGVEFPELEKNAIENNIVMAKKAGNTVSIFKNSVVPDSEGTILHWDNPNEFCEFKTKSPRERCRYCGSLKKYMRNKPCPAFKWLKTDEDVQLQ